MDKGRILLPVALAVALGQAFSCGSVRHIRTVTQQELRAEINIADDYAFVPDSLPIIDIPRRDTFQIVDLDGHEMMIMNAVADDNGEMVARDVINAAVVTARFRNIAERHGKVDLKFDITVPKEMLDSRWQLRFQPWMTLLDETSELEPIVVTGKDYRASQLKGYDAYRKYIESIITDTTLFIHQHLLEVFLEREIPALKDYRKGGRFADEYVDYNDFESQFGVTGQMAVDHYTNMLRKRTHKRRWDNRDKAFGRFVKVPLRTEGLRLDTVIANPDGGFTYAYVQTIAARPKLKKADITLEGEIYEGPSKIYTIPETEPITFYISSLSAFVDNSERYMTTVLSRRVEANSACWIDFSQGSSDIDISLGANRTEIARIKDNLGQLLLNEEFDMDSITVLASCSPEGTLESNTRLAQSRAESVTGYFRQYMKNKGDSIMHSRGTLYNLDDSYDVAAPIKASDIRFTSRSRAENWTPLDTLVKRDSILTPAQKKEYASMREEYRDLDLLEGKMQAKDWYRRLREVLYPRLRTVEFTFYLHRRGMVRDTIRTTVLDTAYMHGVEYIVDREYDKAITQLRPYHPDFNLAVAYCAMDYNASAMEILSALEPTDKVNYMLALLYARKGDDREAIQHYIRSVRQNSSYIYRGNLDPEISELIKKYNLAERLSDDNLSI